MVGLEHILKEKQHCIGETLLLWRLPAPKKGLRDEKCFIYPLVDYDQNFMSSLALDR